MTPPPGSLPVPVAALLRHFRAQRPLRAGSLLVTIFGDCIAPRGGAVTLGSLIRLARPFGVTERLVRTSVARLAREDWLTARRQGRRAEYRLSAGGSARFEEATARIYGPVPESWDGGWTLLLFPGAAPGTRLREALHWRGFGQLQRGLFAHPAMTPAQVRAFLDNGARAQASAVILTATTSTPGAEELLAAGWNLKELATAYGRFVKRFAAVSGAVAGAGLTAEAAFIVRTLLIHEYRKVHLKDPLLPPALLAPGWIGTQAYELCGQLYGRLFGLAETHLDAVAHRLEKPLPPANAAARARFGARG
jgi:phenylacetic acid degradation operon negative regulatory protein